MKVQAIKDDSRTGHAVILALCISGALIEGYDLQAASVTAPLFAHDLGMGTELRGAAFTLNTFGLFLGALLGGWLADRYSRKWTLVGSIAMFGIFCVLNAYSGTISHFLTMRFLVGLGLGGALPNLIALAAQCGPDKTRVHRVTIMTAGMPLGGAIISGLVSFGAIDDWRQAFLLGGIVPIVIALAMGVVLPSKATVIQMQSNAPDRAHKDPSPILPPSFTDLFVPVNRRSTMMLWISFFLTLSMLYLILNWLPSLLIARGVGEALAVRVSLGFNIGGAVGAVFLASILTRFGPRRIFLVTYIGLVIASGAMAFLGNDFVPILIAGTMVGCFVLGAQFLLYGLAADVYEQNIRGIGVGSAVSVGRLGAVAGPAVATLLLSIGVSPNIVIVLIAPVALAALVAVLTLLNRN